MRFFSSMAVAMVAVLASATGYAYPTDQFERTQIRRLKWQHDVDSGARHGRKLPAGATWTSERITLKMLSASDYRLTAETPKDARLQAGLEAILKKPDFRRYNVALLDISDPQAPRFAAVREQETLIPGSVAKILIGAALMRALKDRFGDNIAAREALLRDVKVVADDWALPNSHEVPVIDGDNVAIRPVRRGDTFTLWEWLDHMLSPSSNAAASMTWREVTLMNLLKDAYPPPTYDASLWTRFDRATLTQAAFAAVDQPLLDVGIDPETFKLHLFFTKGAEKYVSGGPTLVSPLALLQWLVTVEQGRMVDSWSSLELKRMLYLTRRRVRYAQAKVLTDAALFFKSGSYYQCAPEPGFVCEAYQGNVINVLNALVEVETTMPLPKGVTTTTPREQGSAAPTSPATVAVATATVLGSAASTSPATIAVTNATTTATDITSNAEGTASGSASSVPAATLTAPMPAAAPTRTLVYMIAVMSNELRRSSADDHAKLAGYVHELLMQ